MASVIGVTISLLVVFLIIVVIITISYNQHKLCFKGKPILQVFMFAIDSALERKLSKVALEGSVKLIDIKVIFIDDDIYKYFSLF